MDQPVPKQEEVQKKILVVEDEKAMAKALEIKLNKSGFTAKAVFNGETAISELQATSYDLMLLDLLMPKMDGFQVLEKVKALGIKTKVIVSSNLGQEEDIKKAKALGATDYLVKSNTPINAIVDKVKSHLG